mgnify:CR=1 FL=1
MILSTRQMLLDAQAGHYAVPAFNIHNLETLQVVADTASEMHSPLIIAVTPSTIDYARDEYVVAMLILLQSIQIHQLLSILIISKI